MLPRGLIRPWMSTLRISTNCSTTCATLPRTSKNSAQPSRLDRTRSSARAILDNTNRENNNEGQDYLCETAAMSRRTRWLLPHLAEQLVSTIYYQRQNIERG